MDWLWMLFSYNNTACRSSYIHRCLQLGELFCSLFEKCIHYAGAFRGGRTLSDNRVNMLLAPSPPTNGGGDTKWLVLQTTNALCSCVLKTEHYRLLDPMLQMISCTSITEGQLYNNNNSCKEEAQWHRAVTSVAIMGSIEVLSGDTKHLWSLSHIKFLRCRQYRR